MVEDAVCLNLPGDITEHTAYDVVDHVATIVLSISRMRLASSQVALVGPGLSTPLRYTRRLRLVCACTSQPLHRSSSSILHTVIFGNHKCLNDRGSI